MVCYPDQFRSSVASDFMSMAPHLLPKSRVGNKMGDWKLQDSMLVDGLTNAFDNYHM
jgi:acetyl-CoA C-acetyltransferase